MFGLTIIRKDDLQALKLSEKALREEMYTIINQKNEYKLRYNIAQAELKKWKPQRDENGKFIKKQAI